MSGSGASAKNPAKSPKSGCSPGLERQKTAKNQQKCDISLALLQKHLILSGVLAWMRHF